MTISSQAIENIVNSVINHMVLEAAYKGETVSSSEIVLSFLTDPEGETAAYFNRSVSDSVEIAVRMKQDASFLSMFGTNVN